MAKARTFKTHTGLLIYLVSEGEKPDLQHVVSIVGSQEKELLRTPDKRAATTYFNGLVKHYEEREKAEA